MRHPLHHDGTTIRAGGHRVDDATHQERRIRAGIAYPFRKHPVAVRVPTGGNNPWLASSATVARTSLAGRLFPTHLPLPRGRRSRLSRSTPNNPSEVLGATSERPVDSHTSMLVFNSNASVGIGLSISIFWQSDLRSRAICRPLYRKGESASAGSRVVRAWRAFHQVNGVLLPIRYWGTEL